MRITKRVYSDSKEDYRCIDIWQDDVMLSLRYDKPTRLWWAKACICEPLYLNYTSHGYRTYREAKFALIYLYECLQRHPISS